MKEISAFEEMMHSLAVMRIEIDLDDGVKRNYEFFTDIPAKRRQEVTATEVTARDKLFFDKLGVTMPY